MGHSARRLRRLRDPLNGTGPTALWRALRECSRALPEEGKFLVVAKKAVPWKARAEKDDRHALRAPPSVPGRTSPGREPPGRPPPGA